MHCLNKPAKYTVQNKTKTRQSTLVCVESCRTRYQQLPSALSIIFFIAIIVLSSVESTAQVRQQSKKSEINQVDTEKSPAADTNNAKAITIPKSKSPQLRRGDSVKLPQEKTEGEALDEKKFLSTQPMAETPVVETPTEFQFLIESSIGRLLPIYGRDLFSANPSTFAPIDRVPVTADYVIGPGDEVVIRAWGQIDIDFRTTVDRNGEIFVPKVGNINLSGLKYQQLNDYLKTVFGRVFKNFDLTSSLGQLRAIQVYVVGQATRPGTYTLSSMSTLVSALFAAGGPSQSGSMRSIQLKRSGKLVTDLDLYSLIGKGDMSADVRLLPGDVIFIPPVGPQAAVAGSVNKAAIFELKGDTKLLQLIELAGGVSTVSSADKLTVERIVDKKYRVIEELDWSRIDKNMTALSGDVFQVWPVSPKFERTVSLRGNVLKTSRYPWREGMKLSDLLPNKAVLISPDYWLKQNSQTVMPQPGSAERQQISPDYWLNQNSQTVMPQPRPAEKQQNKTEGLDIKGLEKSDIKRMLEEINWEYAVVERLDPVTLQQKLIPFNLGNLFSGNDSANNLTLIPGDSVVIFSKSDLPVPVSQQTKFITLAGEFKAAGIYQALQGETLQQLIKRVGGLTNDAFIYAAEFTRESNRITQEKQFKAMLERMERDLEGAASQRLQSATDAAMVAAEKANIDARRETLQRMRTLRPTGRIPLEVAPDAGIEQIPDLALEDGDKIVIPPKPSVIYVMGAVFNENSFLYKTNKTYENYLAQAGGATRDGDESRIYVLKADGSVATDKSAWFKLGSSRQLLPGDTIVVPEKQDKSSFTKQLRDWTQILYQFGIGVAALRVLRN
jgi:protein involved in polysaccharide export with SLBB domain